MSNAESITIVEYRGFQQAYDFFNAELFDGELPNLLVTLQRKANARGYFAPDRFRARGEDNTVHELALNPDTFDGRTDEEILSTLVHEMAHAWQECFGKPSRSGYHNKELASKMESVGLMSSDTGAPGGKKTGQRMTHYIITGGPYAAAYAALQQQGYRLGWQAAARDPKTAAAKNKVKFSCAVCGQNAWAKPEAAIACGPCGVMMDAAS